MITPVAEALLESNAHVAALEQALTHALDTVEAQGAYIVALEELTSMLETTKFEVTTTEEHND